MSAPIQKFGWPTRAFLGVVGVVMAWMALSIPHKAGLVSLPFIEDVPNDCARGFVKPLVASSVFVLLAAEMFMGQFTQWVGGAFKAIIERLTGKAVS